jgi:hypothetical protein
MAVQPFTIQNQPGEEHDWGALYGKPGVSNRPYTAFR